MIRSMKIKGLNNRVDAAIEFNEDLNIITGRNGSGKTTLLKLIWYVISGNIERILPEIPFQFVSIETDSFLLSITQAKPGEGKLHCEFTNENNRVVDFILLQSETIEGVLHRLNQRIVRLMHSSLFFPSFRRVEGGFSRISRYTTGNDVWFTFEGVEGLLQEALSDLSTDLSTYNNCKFIASISTHDIGELLKEKHTDISKKTDELQANLSKEITQRISETNQLEDVTPVLMGIQKRVAQVSQERESLLKPFSILSTQISDIFQYEGIRIAEGITLGEENGAVDSDNLSAGEKQLLSFLCYNTFSENTAIFIDEPELSLHVDWQRLLLPTLLEQETGNQFFIATHSPFIYAKYPDKEILLGEDRGGD